MSLGRSLALEADGVDHLALMGGERVDSSLSLGNRQADEAGKGYDVLILTNKRVVHSSSKGRRLVSIFVNLSEVFAVELTDEHPGGFSGYIWGGLAFVVAFMVWQIWDRPVMDVLAAAAIALMGVYLVLDHLMAPLVQRVTIRAGPSQLQLRAGRAVEQQELQQFVKRLFELKGNGGSGGADSRIIFAPR